MTAFRSQEVEIIVTRKPGPDAARWEHFSHGADIGVRGIGASKEEAFTQAALALTGVVTEPSGVEPRQELDVRCEAADDELLLMAWLNSLICEMSARRMLFSRFAPRIQGRTLTAAISGETADPQRHKPAVEPKGATLTALRVVQEDGVWTAQCVVDV